MDLGDRATHFYRDVNVRAMQEHIAEDTKAEEYAIIRKNYPNHSKNKICKNPHNESRAYNTKNDQSVGA
ncbi:hypothetical protein TYM08_P0111 [Marinicellulosiphila megalodicopiae]